jgi:polysaccharide biosynthesis transport protein
MGETDMLPDFTADSTGAANAPSAEPFRAAAAAGATSDRSVMQILWRQRRGTVWCTAGCIVLSFMYLLAAPKVYTATSRVLVQKADPTSIGPQQRMSEDENSNYLTTQCELLRSTPILSAIAGLSQADQMRVFDGVSNRMLFLKRNLTAEVGKRDDIITVSFASRYPDDAVKIVDAAVDAYSKYTAGRKLATANEVIDILQRQMQQNHAELDADNVKIIELKRAAHTMSFASGDKGNYTLARLQSLSDALTAAHLETINGKSALDAAAKTIGLEGDSIPDSFSAGMALGAADQALLRAQIVALNQQLQERRRIYLPDHPIIQQLEARINQLNMAYVSAVKVGYEQCKTREAELQKSYDQQQLAAMDLSAKASQAQQLDADAKRLMDVIDGLQTRIKDVSMTVGTGALNITVLEPASYEDNPTRPNKAQIPLIALVMGLLIGCAWGVLRELMDPKLHTADDVKAIVPLPVMGIVPRKNPPGTPGVLGQIVHLDSQCPMSEAIRAVRTSLQFGVEPARLRSILITSPEPGDGKSTLASNLAIALASAGKRVLLLDGDLRNPSQHRIFAVRNESGFSDVLGGLDVPDASAIQATGVKNLDLFTAGPIRENPSELLNHPALSEMLSALYEQYDHVVIDSPPVMPVDDARILAATCDCTILVARAQKTSQATLKASVDRLADVGAFVAGAVLNAAQGSDRYGRYGAMAETISVGGATAAQAKRRTEAFAPPARLGAAPILEDRQAPSRFRTS